MKFCLNIFYKWTESERKYPGSSSSGDRFHVLFGLNEDFIRFYPHFFLFSLGTFVDFYLSAKDLWNSTNGFSHQMRNIAENKSNRSQSTASYFLFLFNQSYYSMWKTDIFRPLLNDSTQFLLRKFSCQTIWKIVCASNLHEENQDI
jgi:hypothetical protein